METKHDIIVTLNWQDSRCHDLEFDYCFHEIWCKHELIFDNGQIPAFTILTDFEENLHVLLC